VLLRLLALLVLAGWSLAAPAADARLVEELRKGGYVLYLRHASTDFSKDDTRMASFEDCANQRPLTDKGRDEARALGRQIKRLGIPVDKVYASPFCRTVETAMLAFGKAEKTQEVRGGPMRSDDPRRYAALRTLLSAPPAPGSNNVISSHGNPFYALFGAPYLAEGELAAVRPDGPAGYTVVDRIRLEDWAALQ
jgi:hypothetical protein